jgi:hypothetical protein
MRAAILTAQAPSSIDLDALQASESEGLLSQLVHQRARLQQHVATAIDFGDIKAAISAEGAITANLALVGKLLGMIVQRHDVRSTSLLISPDYLRLRSTLIDALRPFPEAAKAVGAALHRLESDAATDITAAASKRPARPEPVLIEHEAAVPITVLTPSPAPPVTVLPPPPC